MLTEKKRIALLAALLAFSGAAVASEASHDVVAPARNDITNVASLQRGARNFVNYCMGCHSARYVRYGRLGQDLGLSEQQVIDNLMFTGERIHDTMKISMRPEDAARWFGTTPPDLSLIARSRGPDYIYSFLKSFYLDPSRPTGVNNRVMPQTAMPDVLWELQGLQEAVYDGESDAEHNAVHKRFKEFRSVRPGTMAPKEYDDFVRDTVNFLVYIGEPMQLERRSIGLRVLTFLLVFFLFAYFLKKEYWKDVK
ncbi:MAG TPA: cytochrome c1 [Steroidobacteraceae bacterium]|jgi:ubiquinol-cytochrome c reductase cytochrome c1 subunit|nr:cytochrome c1 [Steroidobacteraceae bacterium]